MLWWNLRRLRSKSVNARCEAAKKLGNYTQPEVVDALIRALADNNAKVRKYAVQSLGRIGNRHAAPAIVHLIEREDKRLDNLSLAEEIIDTLAKLGDPCAIEPLIALLQDKMSLSRQGYAAKALRKFKDPRCIEPLLLLLQETQSQSYYPVDDRYIHHIVDTLSEFHDHRIEPVLIKWLEHRNFDNKNWSETKLSIIQALLKFNNGRSGDHLLSLAVDDTNNEVRSAASSALNILNWVPENDSQRATMAIWRKDAKYLEGIGNEAPEHLSAALDYIELRAAAEEALVRIGMAGVEAVQYKLASSNQDVRQSAARILTKIGPDATNSAAKHYIDKLGALFSKAEHLVDPIVSLDSNSTVPKLLHLALGTSSHYVAKDAVSVLTKVLQNTRAIRELNDDLLHSVTAMSPIEMEEFNQEYDTFPYIISVDCSAVRLIAEKELQRRGKILGSSSA